MGHISLHKLLGGVEQDLFTRQSRIHPDQVHGILELVAKAKSAACLVEAATSPNTFGKRLVFEPILIPVKFRLVGLNFHGSHQAEPPLTRSFKFLAGGFEILVLLHQFFLCNHIIWQEKPWCYLK